MLSAMKSLCLVLATCASLAAHAQAPDALRANGARIVQHLQALSEFGKNPQGGVSRLAYSEADRQGREYATRLMREAALDVSIDLPATTLALRPVTAAPPT